MYAAPTPWAVPSSSTSSAPEEATWSNTMRPCSGDMKGMPATARATSSKGIARSLSVVVLVLLGLAVAATVERGARRIELTLDIARGVVAVALEALLEVG